MIKKTQFFFYILLISVSTLIRNVLSDPCYASGYPSPRPNQYLQFCTAYTGSACCALAHDSDINDDFNSAFANGVHCLDNFAILKSLFCIACNPNQPNYTNTITNVVRVCKSFANQLYPIDNNEAMTKMDTCGMYLRGVNNSQYTDPNCLCGGNGNNFYTARPFGDAQSFLNAMIPLFMEDFSFIITDPTIDNLPCLNNSSYTAANLIMALIVLILAKLLLH